MRNIILVLATLSLASLLCSPVQAGLRWDLSPDLQIQQQFNDNLFQSRTERESDWITVFSAGLELQAQGRTEGMSLSYRPSYSMYNEYDQFDTVRHNSDLEIWKDLSKNLRLSLFNSFERREQPYDPDDIEIDEMEQALLDFLDIDYDLRRGREPRSINNSRLRFDYQFGPRSDAYLQYRLRNEWNDNPGEEDSIRHSPSAGLTYWLNYKNGLQLRSGYTQARYDPSADRDNLDGSIRYMRKFIKFLNGYLQYRHSHTSYRDDNNDYTVYEPSLGLSYYFTDQGSLSLGLGYYFRDEQNEDLKEDLVVNADINNSWTMKRSIFRLRGSSGYGESYNITNADGFTVYYHAHARYSYALLKDLRWEISAGYRHNDYKDREPERQDDIYTIGSGLNYMWTRHIHLGLNYDYRNVESNIKHEEYYENRGILSISLRPQGWMWK